MTILSRQGLPPSMKLSGHAIDPGLMLFFLGPEASLVNELHRFFTDSQSKTCQVKSSTPSRPDSGIFLKECEEILSR